MLKVSTKSKGFQISIEFKFEFVFVKFIEEFFEKKICTFDSNAKFDCNSNCYFSSLNLRFFNLRLTLN